LTAISPTSFLIYWWLMPPEEMDINHLRVVEKRLFKMRATKKAELVAPPPITHFGSQSRNEPANDY
jgi:hypothetical protein